MKFRNFEKLIGRMYRDDYEKMEDEIFSLKITKEDTTKRLDQLRKYRKLDTCVKGAQTILKFAEEYKLSGDFDQIRNMARVS